MAEFGILIAICMCVIVMIGLAVNNDTTEKFVEYNSDNIENDFIQDDITKELSDFDAIINTIEDIPDVSMQQFYKYPYYEEFPYDINTILINYIQTKLKDTYYEKDKILITKNPYDIYYTDILEDGFKDCIFYIDIVNNTHFFTRKLHVYMKINEENYKIQMKALRVYKEELKFKYISLNTYHDEYTRF